MLPKIHTTQILNAENTLTPHLWGAYDLSLLTPIGYSALFAPTTFTNLYSMTIGINMFF